MAGVEVLLEKSGATRTSGSGGLRPAPAAHQRSSSGPPSFQVDEQECQPGDGPEQLTGASHAALHTHHALGAEEVDSSLPALPLPERETRDGFDYAVPACFSGHFFWAKEVFEAHRTLASARQRVSGPCFSDEGRPWTILEVQETMQAEMAVLDNPEVTTYSWRRMAPTLAQLLERLESRPEELAALGDWQNKGDQPDVGQMALQYSSAKYAASIKIKSVVWAAASMLTDQLSREAIPQEELARAKAHGVAEAERLLRRDRFGLRRIGSRTSRSASSSRSLAAIRQLGRESWEGGGSSAITSDAIPTRRQSVDGNPEDREAPMPRVSDG